MGIVDGEVGTNWHMLKHTGLSRMVTDLTGSRVDDPSYVELTASKVYH